GEARGRKLVGESKPKAQLKPQARSLSEISENESKTKFELNEDSFLVSESKPQAQLELSEQNFLIRPPDFRRSFFYAIIVIS
ncbi:MAG: hypothetical protein SPL57_06845, partial [Lachnospiraceae bacterium]|nr:hypothetical protein [Lachnospiraceae bacterium]